MQQAGFMGLNRTRVGLNTAEFGTHSRHVLTAPGLGFGAVSPSIPALEPAPVSGHVSRNARRAGVSVRVG